jgi:hypothetical protein
MNFKSLSPHLASDYDNDRMPTSQISLLPTMSLHSITGYINLSIKCLKNTGPSEIS